MRAGARRLGWHLALVLACASAQAPRADAFGFNVDPARVELTVPAGKRRGKTLIVNNRKKDVPIHLTIYATDVIYLPDGTHDFPPAGSTSWSAANWIQVSPQVLDIPAGGQAQVRVSVTAPPDASGGNYAALFFETGSTYTEDAIGVNFRLGALVEVVVPGTGVMKAKLANLTIKPPQQLVVDVFNEGNVLIRPRGKIKILDDGGKRIGQLELNRENVGILPNSLRSFSVPIEPALTTGRYRLRAEIDYGSRQILVGELPVQVP